MIGFSVNRCIAWLNVSAAIALSTLATPLALGAEKAAARPMAPPLGYVACRAKTPIKVDGKLDEADWKAAPWTDAFVDIEGMIRPRPRYRTRAKMLWDDQYFYIAAQLEEPHVWGTLTKHDSVIFADNDFEVFIDPDGDNQEYYELEMNALNTEWDLILKKAYRDGGPAVNEWEVPGLKTGVHVEGTLNDPSDIDSFWSVEWAIPWKVLAEYAHRPSPPKDGDQWRVNFSRVEWRHEVVGSKYKKPPGREDNWVWSPQGVVDMHRPERWGYVQFSTAEQGKAKYRPDPAGPVRDRLMQIFTAQRKARETSKRWATTARELDLPKPPPGFPAHTLEIKPTGDGYLASITFTPPGQAPRTLSIRQDSRLTESQQMPQK